MKNTLIARGRFSKSVAYAAIITGVAYSGINALHAQLPGGTVVSGDLDVGNTSTKGSLRVNGPTGSSAFPGLTVNGDGGVVFKGTWGTGTIPATGAGARFLWFPKKSAIRAGSAYDTEWDEANIGLFSTAFGGGNMAYGQYSVAMGMDSIAAGNYSLVFGTEALANSTNSVAIGSSAEAYGYSSFAIGMGTKAQAMQQIVLGYFNIAQGTEYSDSPEDNLLIVGNGTGSVRSNALAVKRNGVLSLFPPGNSTASIVMNPSTPSITVGGQSVLTANSSANFAFGGNLGVGNNGITSAHPDADNIVLGSTTGSNGLTLFGSTLGRSNVFFGSAASPYASVLSFNHENSKLQIGGAAYESTSALYLDSSGRLGIGTSSPTARLHAFSATSAEIRAQTSSTSATVGINLIGGSAAADWWMFTNRADLASASSSLGFFKGTGTAGTKMVITDGGSVGIATTTPNPSYRLDVNGYSGLGGLRINGNDESNTLLSPDGKQIAINAVAGNGITVKATGAVLVGAWNDTAQQKFNVVGKSYFSDSVGIGTASPSAKLEVSGSVKFTKQGDIPMGEFGLNGD